MSKTIGNINSNLALLVVNTCVTFIMTPVLIKNMGDHDYGIFVLVMSIVGYMSILDLGLSPAISRFIAKYNAVNDIENVQRYFGVALKILLVIGIFSFLVLMVVYLVDPHILAPDDSSIDNEYSIALVLLSLQVLFAFPRLCLISTLQGKQLFTVNNKVSIVVAIVASSFIVWAIDEDNGLLLVLSVGLATGLFKTLYFYIYISKRLNIKLKHLPFLELRNISSELLKFSAKSFIQSTSARLANHSDSIIIAGFLAASYIVIYTLPLALFKVVMNVVGSIVSVFLPIFTELNEKNEKDKLVDSYVSSTRLVSSVSFYGLGAVYLLADNFIGMWIGVDYAEKTAEIIPYMALYGLVYLYNPLGNMLVTALNKHDYFAKLSIYEAVSNIVISIILINIMGLVGVVIGTLLSCLVSKILKTLYCAEVLHVDLIYIALGPIKSILLPCLIPLAVILYLDVYATSVINFAVICIMSTFLWITLMSLLGITKEERTFASDFILKRHKVE